MNRRSFLTRAALFATAAAAMDPLEILDRLNHKKVWALGEVPDGRSERYNVMIGGGEMPYDADWRPYRVVMAHFINIQLPDRHFSMSNRR